MHYNIGNNVLEVFRVKFKYGVTYEEVAEFIYLATLINNDNSVEKEI